MPAGIDGQGVDGKRRLAAADALVAGRHPGGAAGGRLLPLGAGALALARDLLASSRERLTLRRLLRPHVRERLFRLRGPSLGFPHGVARAHELRLFFGQDRACEIELGHERGRLFGSPHPLEPLPSLLVHVAVAGAPAFELSAACTSGVSKGKRWSICSSCRSRRRASMNFTARSYKALGSRSPSPSARSSS